MLMVVNEAEASENETQEERWRDGLLPQGKKASVT